MTLKEKKNLPFRIWNGNPSGDRLIIYVQQRHINAHLHLIPPIITSDQTLSALRRCIRDRVHCCLWPILTLRLPPVS